MTSNPTYTVMMHSKLVDQLDYSFSPADGIQAIDDFLLELPKAHRSREDRRRRRSFRKTFKAYHGWLEWGCLGFTYVQVGDQLHVVELWDDIIPERQDVDVVIGRRAEDP